ncbi:hypothetical protein AXA44_45225 [Rhodococcus sp. SC4]|nr:hypothetical protein AXA44_45225 [Rhodococcus sp. SC4]
MVIKETNVRVPKCALDSLAEISEVLGLSRDATVRQLIIEYVERFEYPGLDPDDRLTHISTVMRHPLPRRVRGEAIVGEQLRLRLPDGMARRARAVAFRIPGQARSRGHHDYQPRLLTDAVMTAIAIECQEKGLEPITDDVLDGLHPLLRHRSARGLWRLAVSASQSGAEKEVFDQAEQDREQREILGNAGGPWTHAEQVAALLRGEEASDEEDAAWHHRHRSLIVQRLAHLCLSGAPENRHRMEQRLYDQDEDHQRGKDEKWDALRADIKSQIAPLPESSEDEWGEDEAKDHRSDLARQSHAEVDFNVDPPFAPHVALGSLNLEGRGGGAVWRAQRKLAVAEIIPWIRASAHSDGVPRTHEVGQPGWRLVLPDDWQPIVLPRNRPLPEDWAARVAAGRVLHLLAGSRQMLWPTVLDDNSDEVPVPRIEAVLAGMSAQKSESQVEILLMELLPATADEAQEWDHRTHNPRALPPPKTLDEILGKTSAAEGGIPPLPGPEMSLPSTSDSDSVVLSDEPNSFEFMRPVLVPADTACEFGFIDKAQRDRLVRDAETQTKVRMRSALRRLPSWHWGRRKELEDAMADPARFTALANTLDVDFREIRAVSPWPVTSLADEIVNPTHAPALGWLAHNLCRSHTRELERSMQDAYDAAVQKFSYLYSATTTDVTSTV